MYSGDKMISQRLFGEYIIRRKRMGSLMEVFFQVGIVKIPFLF